MAIARMFMLIILICVSVIDAEIVFESSLDNFVLDPVLEEILRNTRSEMNEIDNWQQADNSNNDNFIVTDRNPYQKAYGRKKAMALNLYRSRSFNFKERVEKKNNINNNNIKKFVLCHFKICNMPMGKRKTRFLHYWDMMSVQ